MWIVRQRENALAIVDALNCNRELVSLAKKNIFIFLSIEFYKQYNFRIIQKFNISDTNIPAGDLESRARKKMIFSFFVAM